MFLLFVYQQICSAYYLKRLTINDPPAPVAPIQIPIDPGFGRRFDKLATTQAREEPLLYRRVAAHAGHFIGRRCIALLLAF